MSASLRSVRERRKFAEKRKTLDSCVLCDGRRVMRCVWCPTEPVRTHLINCPTCETGR